MKLIVRGERMMRIGLLGAMAEEVDELANCMDVAETVRKGMTDFHLGTLSGQSVVLAYSGIGKVNAGAAVQMMADWFGIDALIFTGVAGGLDPLLDVGDLVISEDALQHDFDSTAFGYDRGRIPRLKKKLFYADRTLMERFLRAAHNLKDDLGGARITLGRVLSGDQFIASPEHNRDLFLQFAGQCVEMEGAAAAQVCYLNQIPFVIVRAISDRADQSARVDYRVFVAQAVARSCRLVQQVLNTWDED
jgi:adenosylhomocysteine nucleosidase